MRLLPVIARDRLVAEIVESLPKLVKLVAPAGYGKSTLTRVLSERLGASVVVDLANAPAEIDVCRSLVEGLSPYAERNRRELMAEQSIMCGSDRGAWQTFATECLRLAEIDVLILENAESLVGADSVLRAIEQLLRNAPSKLHVVVCARVEPGLRLGRFAGPDRTRMVGSDELTFDRNEIAKLFSDVSLRRGELDAIARFTRGWPIVVMMLYTIARRGRLTAYLQQEHDVADLYGYLASEVYRFLDDGQRAILEAVAAIPDARESDLAALFPDIDYAAPLEALEQGTPFISRGGDTRIEVHPAMRQMLAQQADQDRVLARLYETVDRGDGGARAAQIALHRKRPHDAAAAIAASAGPYWLSTPSSEVNQILGALPDDVIYMHPALWSAAALTRASLDVVTWIESGRRLYDSLGAETPLEVRLGFVSALANAYLNRGRFTEAKLLLAAFQESADNDPMAAMVVSFWSAAISAYRGELVDVQRFQIDHALLLASPGTTALVEYDIVARSYRLHGKRSEERATLERAIEIARSSQIPVIVGVCLCDAAFGAWLWGEDRLFQQHIEELDGITNPFSRPLFAHFVGCVHGHYATTSVSTEKLKTRACGYLIAASLSKTDTERIALAREAVIAADQSSQRYVQVLARLGLAFCDAKERDVYLTQAHEIAAETCSAELLRSVSAIRLADATGTMFEAFQRRFGYGAVTKQNRVLVDIANGYASIEGCREPLRPREAELAAFLAIAARPVRRDEVLRALWPDQDGESAAASFKTYVSRLRRIAGDPNLIVREATRYRLGTPALISGDPGEPGGPANWKWFARARGLHD